ncbi:MAG: tRNA (adenosine(37)-N6)-threonylcarbamoyltransferase complex dimerization subunit type 1 TsaB [Pyrinomonadaceae bacterium]
MIILALESAIAGGSISLLDDGREIAHWIGTSNVSKAEDLLVNIDKLLASNNIHRNDIGLIAASAGPGSFTGIRIGIATALGLKTGLNIPMSSESALKAMAFSQPDSEEITVAVPMGRNAVCLQSFQKKEEEIGTLDEPQTMSEDKFLSLIQEPSGACHVLHSILFEKAAHTGNIINFGANIACSVGNICRINPGVITEPLFISKSF